MLSWLFWLVRLLLCQTCLATARVTQAIAVQLVCVLRFSSATPLAVSFRCAPRKAQAPVQNRARWRWCASVR